MTERVGIVGESFETMAETVEAAGGKALIDNPRADPTFVISVGESGLYSLVPDPPAPVLPIDAGPGVRSIPSDDAAEVITTLLDESRSPSQPQPESYPTTSHPIVSVDWKHGDERNDVDNECENNEEESTNNGNDEGNSNDDEEGRVYALVDVTLVTAEPARISEYAIASGGEHVTSVRADGVVVATPAGSHGYAHDAGGPRLAPETDVGTVVPIAPFAISDDYWVLSLSDIRLTVERDDASVDLFVDGQRIRTVSPDDTLSIRSVDTLETIQVSQRGLERL